MRLLRLWKIGSIIAAFGLLALVAAACSGSQTVTSTAPAPPAVTVTSTAPALPAVTVTSTAPALPAVTVTAPAPPTPKVSQTLTLQADTVVSAQGVKNPADICIQSSRFPQGEGVVWRVKVYDPATGQPMDDKALDSVVVSLKDGQTFKAAYGGHPGGTNATPSDYFWSTAWHIPATYPTGSVPYTVTATSKDGRTGTFNQFNVAPSLLLVVAAQ